MHGSFDERAATWDDDPAKIARAAEVAAAIRDAVALDRSARMLEYGAGTGLVTEALLDDVGEVTLADTSAGMREVMQRKVEAGVLRDARVWDVDLSSGPVPDETFDVIVTSMALHHIPEVDAVLSAFATLTAAGGHVCIVDLEEEDGSFHGDGFDGHHGFARPWLEERLRAAGFGDVAFRTVGDVVRPTGTYPLFLATAVRAGG
ncbi:MAG TPA: class I SAM-dependent methyltransferase [Acidimicrobiales bacterium]|nr:class I SAM-dependent methyltransferase [Acidimicrobiales bacterium]